MKYERLWKQIPNGAFVLCLTMCNACATTSSIDPPRPEPPEYIIEPCHYPDPRPVETNEDLLELMADFRADLEDCGERHRLLIQFVRN